MPAGISWLRVGATLAVGALGVLAARALAVPGGAFTGAMLATAAASLLKVPVSEPPKGLKSTARIVLGITVGASVTSDTISAVASALLPVAIMVVTLVALSLLVAWALTRWTRMDPATALCSSSPGALAAMVALADDLGGDAPVVASMHLVRLVSVLLFVPAFVTAAFARGAAVPVPVAVAAAEPEMMALRLGLLLVAGLAIGFLAVRLKMPAAELLGGMIAAALLNPLLLHIPVLPATWRTFAQWIVGAGVGATVTRRTLHDFRPYAGAGALMMAFMIASGLGLGWTLSRVSGLDLVTCIVGCAPGGADTMIILAGELGADPQLVTAMHVSRMVILTVLLPVITRTATRRLAATARTSLAPVEAGEPAEDAAAAL